MSLASVEIIRDTAVEAAQGIWHQEKELSFKTQEANLDQAKIADLSKSIKGLRQVLLKMQVRIWEINAQTRLVGEVTRDL